MGQSLLKVVVSEQKFKLSFRKISILVFHIYIYRERDKSNHENSIRSVHENYPQLRRTYLVYFLCKNISELVVLDLLPMLCCDSFTKLNDFRSEEFGLFKRSFEFHEVWLVDNCLFGSELFLSGLRSILNGRFAGICFTRIFPSSTPFGNSVIPSANCIFKKYIYFY